MSCDQRSDNTLNKDEKKKACKVNGIKLGISYAKGTPGL